MSSIPFVSGMAIGGSIISALGAGSTMFLEEKKPTLKSVSRDFLIGAFMVIMIMQLLPESATSAVNYLLALAPLSLFSGGTGASGGNSEASSSGILDDFEVKVGVPKF